jgi:hypothetical protein
MAIESEMKAFAAYARNCSDERGDAQVFCDRLFRAFGHKGYKEAGATLETRIKIEGTTHFADLVWKPRAVIEMKKRGERLAPHYGQLLKYWLHATPDRPRYAMLCNFDEFWVYDFQQQMDEPMDRIAIDALPTRYDGLNFLFPEGLAPNFSNNRTAVTDDAARKIAEIYRALVARGEAKDRSQRFALQCVVSMFAEDTGLLPRGLFTALVADCVSGRSSYDLLGSLFHQMNSPKAARAGRYKLVPYFNGGIFAKVDPVELNPSELELLSEACSENWGKINPAIFGTLFQSSMDKRERHEKGAHYTPESEIMRVVLPTIVQPWRDRIASTTTLADLRIARQELTSLRVLDPACGSGNFLYVAYRELKRLEMQILEKMHQHFSSGSRRKVGSTADLRITQFFGIDNDPFAVELAKVTMVLAKKLALDEQQFALDTVQTELEFNTRPLPLENLDANIQCDDALFCNWPKADVIIGNPPFQAKNNMQTEFSPAYVKRVRGRYPGVPGRADYCVYWFRRTHDELDEDARAGLVGTNTIRQNFSREGGLDHIVQNGGSIVDAVSTQVWTGRAVVHVSIVNWVKGSSEGKKRLATQDGDQVESPWRELFLDRIPASLREVDVTTAKRLTTYEKSDLCLQGLTHGHEGFLLTRNEARELGRKANARTAIHPYLTGDELISGVGPNDWRYLIDLSECQDLMAAREVGGRAFEWVKSRVMKDIAAAAALERTKLGKNTGPRQSHAKRWWRLWRGRPELVRRLRTLQRYIACSRVTKRPIFDFVSSVVRPSDVVVAFPLEDEYSFGILQSQIHWLWFSERCSTWKGDNRYTNTTVFDSFPWPQRPNAKSVARIENAAVTLRRLRVRLLAEHDMNLRELYASLEDPGVHPLKDAQNALDEAVRDAYGMGKRDDPVKFIFELNASCAAREAEGKDITGPGRPRQAPPVAFEGNDCLIPPEL